MQQVTNNIYNINSDVFEQYAVDTSENGQFGHIIIYKKHKQSIINCLLLIYYFFLYFIYV